MNETKLIKEILQKTMQMLPEKLKHEAYSLIEEARGLDFEKAELAIEQWPEEHRHGARMMLQWFKAIRA